MTIRKWEVRQRLAFIESKLFWTGRVNRSDIMERFEVSAIQASSDFTRYQEIAPGNVAYDSRRKCYIPTSEFSAVLIAPSAEGYLSQLVHEEEESDATLANVVEEPQRCVDPQVLRQILKAIRERLDIQVMYQSMSQPKPVWRWITPHVLISDHHRWHVRAFCHNSGSFKDFLLARILEIGIERGATVAALADIKWRTQVEVVLVPNQGLTEDQKKVIESDYGMNDGKRVFQVREATLFYFLKNLGLDCPPEKSPEKQQVVVANWLEVEPILMRTLN